MAQAAARTDDKVAGAAIDPQIRFAASAVIAAVVAGGVYFARPVLIPLALAILLAFALAPIVSALRRLHVGGVAHDIALIHHNARPTALELRYRPLLADGDAQVLLDQMRLMLAAVCADPDAVLADVSLVVEAWRANLGLPIGDDDKPEVF